MSSDLILYGVPFSQPVRAVMWLLLYKRQPFDMVLINPGSSGDNGSRHPDYLAKNPAGTIPMIEEPESGFVLAEAHAILSYLANLHEWDDVYPQDPKRRAAVDWYLHYHHRNVRDASLGLVAPKIRKDLDIPQAMQDAARATVTRAVKALDTNWLDGHKFLTGDAPTLADFGAYAELGQLRPEYTNVFDFSAYPNVCRWLDEMARVECHDPVHVALRELGDISKEAPTMDAIRNANREALRALKTELEKIRADP